MEGAGCRSSGVGMSPGTWCRKLLREAIRATHVSRSHSLVLSGVGAGWGLGHVRLAVAGAALNAVRLRHWGSDQVSPPVDGGHPDPASRWGRALAVWGGEWGAVVSGNVEEGIEEEVSDCFPQGGRPDQGVRPDALGGAGGVRGQHLLVPESLEVLPYRCGIV